MPEQQHLDFLLDTLGDSAAGHNKWLEYKQRHRAMDLSEADLSHKDFRDYDFSDTNLSRVAFSGSDLARADFSDARLNHADFRRCNMNNCCLDRADLSMANLQGAVLSDSCIEEADLTDARLQGADLVGADLADSDLSGSDMREANLKYVRFTGAKLDGANVAEADLTGSVLDDDAPNVLRNFDLATIDDRKYRMMKSQIKAPPKKIDGEQPKPAEQPVKPHDRAPEPVPFAVTAKSEETAPTNPAGVTNGARTAEQPPKPPAEPEAPPAPLKATIHETREDGESKERAGRRETIFIKRAAEEPAKTKAFGAAYIATESDLKADEGCCRILGVKRNASYAQITKAYRLKAMVFHPDKVRHLTVEEQNFAREQFQMIKRAYEILTRRRDTVKGNTKSMSNIKWVEGVPRRKSPYEHSLTELLTLVKANPGHESLLYNLAWKFYETGKLDDAIKTFERVLAVNPNNEDAQHNLKVVKIQKAFKVSPAR